jgi:hypothetical protein
VRRVAASMAAVVGHRVGSAGESGLPDATPRRGR